MKRRNVKGMEHFVLYRKTKLLNKNRVAYRYALPSQVGQNVLQKINTSCCISQSNTVECSILF